VAECCNQLSGTTKASPGRSSHWLSEPGSSRATLRRSTLPVAGYVSQVSWQQRQASAAGDTDRLNLKTTRAIVLRSTLPVA
jgi:hypothetical protein